MNLLKTLWGFFFRLFPCPTTVGLRKIGNPGRDSPVIVTCNFHNTVGRLTRKLKGRDVWLLVAESHGVNVWCAAGAEAFSTRSVVSAVKTSGIEDQVDHRRLVMPPLGAPGIKADEVRKQTGWSVRWGPVRARDLPRYLDQDGRRDEPMKRVTWNGLERLDTALGSMFPFMLLGALIIAPFSLGFLFEYGVVSVVTFLWFMLCCPWIPGEQGIVKVLSTDVMLGALLVWTEYSHDWTGSPFRNMLIIAMVMIAVYGTELGGLAPNMKSTLDAWFAKRGIKSIGNVYFSGTVRGELLAGLRALTFHEDRCIGCKSCVEICPLGLWDFGDEKKAVPARIDHCTACRACLMQCPSQAITAEAREPKQTPSPK